MSPRYRACVQTVFSATHYVPAHPEGRRPHGHDFLLRVCVSSDNLDSAGFVVDYYLLRSVVEEEARRLDHTVLNEALGLESASSELVAEALLERIATRLGVEPGRVCVELCGPPDFCVEVNC